MGQWPVAAGITRGRVMRGRPRFDADDGTRKENTEKFIAACPGGDLNALMELLAAEVTPWNDGVVVTAARSVAPIRPAASQSGRLCRHKR